MTSEQRKAEEVDGDALGEQPFDDERPGDVDYPPERPLGVEDPVAQRGGTEARDDLADRAWRKMRDGLPDSDRRGVRLDAGDSVADSGEEGMIARGAEVDDEASAEESAVTLESPDSDELEQ